MRDKKINPELYNISGLCFQPLAPSCEDIKKLRQAVKELNEMFNYGSKGRGVCLKLDYNRYNCEVKDGYWLVRFYAHSMSDYEKGRINGMLEAKTGIRG